MERTTITDDTLTPYNPKIPQEVHSMSFVWCVKASRNQIILKCNELRCFVEYYYGHCELESCWVARASTNRPKKNELLRSSALAHVPHSLCEKSNMLFLFTHLERFKVFNMIHSVDGMNRVFGQKESMIFCIAME